MKRLIEVGANCIFTDIEGFTCLHHAARHGRKEVVRHLVQKLPKDALDIQDSIRYVLCHFLRSVLTVSASSHSPTQLHVPAAWHTTFVAFSPPKQPPPNTDSASLYIHSSFPTPTYPSSPTITFFILPFFPFWPPDNRRPYTRLHGMAIALSQFCWLKRVHPCLSRTTIATLRISAQCSLGMRSWWSTSKVRGVGVNSGCAQCYLSSWRGCEGRCIGWLICVCGKEV